MKQSNKLPGPIDEARERFCLLLILRQMASSEDSENQHLSHLYKCLAAEVDEKKRVRAFSWQSSLAEEFFEMMTKDLRRKQQ